MAAAAVSAIAFGLGYGAFAYTYRPPSTQEDVSYGEYMKTDLTKYYAQLANQNKSAAAETAPVAPKLSPFDNLTATQQALIAKFTQAQFKQTQSPTNPLLRGFQSSFDYDAIPSNELSRNRVQDDDDEMTYVEGKMSCDPVCMPTRREDDPVGFSAFPEGAVNRAEMTDDTMYPDLECPQDVAERAERERQECELRDPLSTDDSYQYLGNDPETDPFGIVELPVQTMRQDAPIRHRKGVAPGGVYAQTGNLDTLSRSSDANVRLRAPGRSVMRDTAGEGRTAGGAHAADRVKSVNFSQDVMQDRGNLRSVDAPNDRRTVRENRDNAVQQGARFQQSVAGSRVDRARAERESHAVSARVAPSVAVGLDFDSLTEEKVSQLVAQGRLIDHGALKGASFGMQSSEPDEGFVFHMDIPETVAGVSEARVAPESGSAVDGGSVHGQSYAGVAEAGSRPEARDRFVASGSREAVVAPGGRGDSSLRREGGAVSAAGNGLGRVAASATDERRFRPEGGAAGAAVAPVSIVPDAVNPESRVRRAFEAPESVQVGPVERVVSSEREGRLRVGSSSVADLDDRIFMEKHTSDLTEVSRGVSDMPGERGNKVRAEDAGSIMAF